MGNFRWKIRFLMQRLLLCDSQWKSKTIFSLLNSLKKYILYMYNILLFSFALVLTFTYLTSQARLYFLHQLSYCSLSLIPFIFSWLDDLSSIIKHNSNKTFQQSYSERTNEWNRVHQDIHHFRNRQPTWTFFCICLLYIHVRFVRGKKVYSIVKNRKQKHNKTKKITA